MVAFNPKTMSKSSYYGAKPTPAPVNYSTYKPTPVPTPWNPRPAYAAEPQVLSASTANNPNYNLPQSSNVDPFGRPIYNPSPITSRGGGGGGGGGGGTSNQGQIDTSNINQNTNTGNEQIDRDYNDFMNQLSGSEQGLQGQAGIATQNVDVNYAPNLSALQTEGATKLQGVAQQGQVAQSQEKTAMMQARDLFRQTQQANIAQLSGMGLSSSSVAQALAETLGVETARRIASVSQSANDIYQNLSKEKANIEGYVATKTTELQQKIAQEKTNIQYQLSEGLRQINEARATAAKDKANRRADLLQQANNAIFTLQQNAQQFAQSLEAWKAQNTSKIASLSNVDWNAQFSQQLTNAPAISGFTPTPQYNIDEYGRQTGQISYKAKPKDEFANPFATE